jgi:transcriptional regulator with XRE-family HTH domain
MAKGKYEHWLSAEGLLLLQAWARDGLTDDQIAENIGVSRSTLSEWKNRFPDILDALKKGKEVVDIQVENALLQKALGINKIVKKPIKVKEVIYDNGKRVKETESIEYADEEIYIPPDTTAQIFWLKNRRPDVWRDKRDVKVEGGLKLEDIL